MIKYELEPYLLLRSIHVRARAFAHTHTHTHMHAHDCACNVYTCAQTPQTRADTLWTRVHMRTCACRDKILMGVGFGQGLGFRV